MDFDSFKRLLTMNINENISSDHLTLDQLNDINARLKESYKLFVQVKAVNTIDNFNAHFSNFLITNMGKYLKKASAGCKSLTSARRIEEREKAKKAERALDQLCNKFNLIFDYLDGGIQTLDKHQKLNAKRMIDDLDFAIQFKKNTFTKNDDDPDNYISPRTGYYDLEFMLSQFLNVFVLYGAITTGVKRGDEALPSNIGKALNILFDNDEAFLIYQTMYEQLKHRGNKSKN